MYPCSCCIIDSLSFLFCGAHSGLKSEDPPSVCLSLFMSCPSWEEIAQDTVKGNFKATLFQIDCSIVFLTHFNRNLPSMFDEEAKSRWQHDSYMPDIDLIVITPILTINSHRTWVALDGFLMAYNKTFSDREIFPLIFGKVVSPHTAIKFKSFRGCLIFHS